MSANHGESSSFESFDAYETLPGNYGRYSDSACDPRWWPRRDPLQRGTLIASGICAPIGAVTVTSCV